MKNIDSEDTINPQKKDISILFVVKNYKNFFKLKYQIQFNTNTY